MNILSLLTVLFYCLHAELAGAASGALIAPLTFTLFWATGEVGRGVVQDRAAGREGLKCRAEFSLGQLGRWDGVKERRAGWGVSGGAGWGRKLKQVG